MSDIVRPSESHAVTTATLNGEALHELLAQVQRGDRPAADRLVRGHDRWLRSVVYGVTGRVDLVDDVTQQVWAQVWERLDSLKEPSRLRSWLYSVARHAAIDAGVSETRRARRMAHLGSAAALAGDQRAGSPVRSVVGSELQATLLGAVEGLPALYREPFVLRHVEGWSYAQIGELLGLPVETVETRLVRARRLLREMLSGKVET